MAEHVVCLNASSARWERKRGLKQKGKRKIKQSGGKKKRRRRKVCMRGLKGHAKFACICKNGCVCVPVVISNSASQTDPPPVCVHAENQTDPEATKQLTRTVGTDIIEHDKLRPKAGTHTAGDKKKAMAGEALKRLKKALPNGFHWTQFMIVVTLRLLFGLVHDFNWGWTQAVYTTSSLLNLAKDTTFKFGNDYLDGENILPNELVMKVRGRGSAKFVIKYGKDRFSKLKEVGNYTICFANTHLFVIVHCFCRNT